MKEISSLTVKSSKIKKSSGESYFKQALIAALIAFFSFIVMAVVASKYPFGDYTFLIGDLEAQYAPFLFMYKRHLLSLNWADFVSSFTYSFSMGAGKNMMGTFGYYLASPLNLLVFLFKETQVNEFIMLLVAIKLSLAAAFMTLFVHERADNKESNWPIAFGLMYAFSSYTMAFMFHIMWLDGYALLPLLLLFVEKFISDKKVIRLIPVLILLFASNYYIAYMVGIFSFFYLIERMLVLGKFSNIKKAIKHILRFVFTAIASALTVGIILIPVGLDTLTNGDPIVTTGSDKLVHYSVVDLVDQVFLGYPGEYTEVMPGNLPFIFISLVVTFLCIIYFVSPVFKGFERRVHAVCMLLVYISLTVVLIDKAWQVFDSPNWFNHRESFVFMPLFIIVAYKTFEKIKEVTNKEIGKALAIAVAMILFAQSFGQMKSRDDVFLFNLCFTAGLALVFAGMKRTKWPEQLANMNKILNIILAIAIGFELIAIAPVMSVGVATMSVYYGDAYDYNEQIKVYNDFLDSGIGEDRGFRTEIINFGSDVKDEYITGGYYGGMRGLSLFNSNSNKTFHRFMKQIGFNTNYNYFSTGYSFIAPDTDAFFSVGRVITPSNYTNAIPLANDNFDLNLLMYGNENVLPLAFPVASSAFDYDFYSLERATQEKNYFDFRNSWYSSMFPNAFNQDFYYAPENIPVLEIVNANTIDMDLYISNELSESDSTDSSSTTVSLNPDSLGLEKCDGNSNVQTAYRINDSIPMIMNFTLVSESSDELYMNISADRLIDGCEVYVNGTYLCGWSSGSFYSQVVRIGSFAEGEEIQVSITSDASSFGYLDVNFAYFDYEAFSNCFANVNTSSVEVTSVSNGVVNISSNLTDDRLILTTIPYEEGWTLYVDGQKADIEVYQGALIGINPGTGSHDITLKFVAPGVKAGAACSIIGILGLAAIIFVEKKYGKSQNS